MKSKFTLTNLVFYMSILCCNQKTTTQAIEAKNANSDSERAGNKNTTSNEDLQTTRRSSSSGIEIGNGGDAIVCYSLDRTRIETVRLLDYFQLHEKSHLSSRENFSLIENLNWLLEKYKSKDLSGYEIIKPLSFKFFDEVYFAKDKILEDVQDSGPLALPNHCQIEQVAIFSETPFLGIESFKHYLVSDTLWNLMPSIDQAGLILHEVLYRLAIAKGHKNSIHIRALNELLANTEWERISDYELTIFLRRRHLWNLFTSTENLCDEILSLHENGHPRLCRYLTEKKLNVGINQFRLIPCSQRRCESIEEDQVIFYESGELLSFASKVYHFRQSNQCSIGGLDAWNEYFNYTFYKSGLIKSINSIAAKEATKQIEYFPFLQQILVDKTCERNLEMRAHQYAGEFFESGISKFSKCTLDTQTSHLNNHPCKFRLYSQNDLAENGYIYLEPLDQTNGIFEHLASNGLPKYGKIACGDLTNHCELKLKISATETKIFKAGDLIEISDQAWVKKHP